MKRLLVVLLVAGCEPGLVETNPAPDMARVYEANMGADCIPEPGEDFNGQAGGSDCPCVPMLNVPPLTTTAGAYCHPEAARCCAWYVVGPPPFSTWTNCGDGWKCEGDGCR